MEGHRPLVFLDIETTGGSPASSRVTEIGALRVENGRVVRSFRQLVNPETPVPYFISKLTGIHDEMLWDAPVFRSIVDELELLLDDALFIAHNVNFDYRFLQMEFHRIGYTLHMDRACTARLSRKLYPQYRSHKLDKVIERMELEVTNRHRAYDDAEVLWKFFSYEYSMRGSDLISKLEQVTTKI